MKTSIFRALLFGILTWLVVAVGKTYLPDSSSKSTLADGLALPGALIASVYYGEGAHTGGGAPAWGFAVAALNFLVYSLFWLAVFVTINWVWRRHKNGSGTI